MTTPAIDFESAMDAFAARFLPATIGTPTGADAMRYSYAEPPNGIPATPSHVLEIQDGEVTPNAGQWMHTIRIDGLLLLSKAPADMPRIETQRQLWLPYLLHATVDQWSLGLGAQSGWGIKSVLPGTWTWDTYAVGGVEYEAIRVHWLMTILENIAATP